jgi:AraC family transcriptional regulator
VKVYEARLRLVLSRGRMQEEYIKRINKVLTFIDENLDSDLSLKTVSEVACYSPFHLHRLFKAITNETLNSYIIRKRIENSAILLVHKKDLSVTEISIKYGFTSHAIFSRAFKKVYGQSPSEFRKSNLNNFSKIGKANQMTEKYLCNINHHKNWMKLHAKIKVHLVYMTHIGEKGIDKSFQLMLNWADRTGMLSKNDTNICRVFHDSFKVTDAQKVRMSIGILTNQALSIKESNIGLNTIEKGKCIVGHFVIEPKEFEQAWSGLYIWMYENGYNKADRFPFEIYHNNFNEHPGKKCIVDLCIPI